MLSRSAQNLYWMGRYLERAEHLGRLMEIQVGSLIDRPIEEILRGFRRIYSHIGAKPPIGGIGETSQGEDHTIADSYTLVDDLTFEEGNNYSIWHCFALGREGARQIRHCVSSEMWLCLNLAYLRIQERKMQDIWLSAPEQFFAEVVRDINTFSGVASSNMYRNEGWQFLLLGRVVEHVILMSSLLSEHSREFDESNGDEFNEYEWSNLLNCYQADEEYQRSIGIEIRAVDVLNMLVTDELLPCALIYAAKHIEERIENVGEAPDARAGSMAARCAGRIVALIRYEWPDTEDRTRMLALIQNLASRLHDQLSKAWFDYEIEYARRDD